MMFSKTKLCERTHLKISKFEIINNLKANIIIVLFTSLYFIKNYLGNQSFVLITTSILMVLLGGISLLYDFVYSKNRITKKYYLAILITMLASSLTNNNYRIQDYFLFMQYIGIGLLIYNYKLNYRIFKYNLYFYIVFFTVNILFGVNVDGLLLNSRNNISIIMLLNMSLFYIAAYQNEKKLSIVPCLINIFVSFWALGRSGILTSILLLVGLLIVNRKNIYLVLNLKYRKGVIVSIIAVLVLFSTLLFDNTLRASVARLISLGFVDQARNSIITEYFLRMTSGIKTALFGVTISGNVIFDTFDGNLHNSYLRLHSFLGIFGLSLMMYLIAKTIIKNVKNREFLYLIFLITILIRISTDIAAFHGPLDPIIYFLIFNCVAFPQVEKS